MPYLSVTYPRPLYGFLPARWLAPLSHLRPAPGLIPSSIGGCFGAKGFWNQIFGRSRDGSGILGPSREGNGGPGLRRSERERARLQRSARENAEREIVQDALRRNKWKITAAALELGISRPTLYELMEKLKISKD